MTDTVITRLARALSETPEDEDLQFAYCRAYARSGYPEREEGVCLVPWCKTRPRRDFYARSFRNRTATRKSKTYCAKHDTDAFSEALGVTWDVGFLHGYSGFYYSGVEVDYHTEYSCQDYGCDYEGICRCGEIRDTRIISLDKFYIGSTATDNLIREHSDIFAYCISRLVYTSVRKSGTADFDIVVTGGYYGDEIDAVLWDKEDELNKKVDQLRNMTDSDRIRFALIDDYGDLLPELENVTFHIREVPADKILFGSAKRKRQLDSEALDHYADHKLPRGVAVKVGDRYRLIDGYHRTTAATGDTVTLVVGE